MAKSDCANANLSASFVNGCRLAFFYFFGFVFVLSSGCGSGSDVSSELQKLNATNVQRLASLYQHYQGQHQGRGPKDETVFKSFVAQVNPLLLERIEIDPGSIDPVFMSERDGEPLVVRYGQRGNSLGPSVPIAFETSGVEGRRMIGFTNSLAMEVEDDQEYQAFMDGKTVANKHLR